MIQKINRNKALQHLILTITLSIKMQPILKRNLIFLIFQISEILQTSQIPMLKNLSNNKKITVVLENLTLHKGFNNLRLLRLIYQICLMMIQLKIIKIKQNQYKCKNNLQIYKNNLRHNKMFSKSRQNKFKFKNSSRPLSNSRKIILTL